MIFIQSTARVLPDFIRQVIYNVVYPLRSDRRRLRPERNEHEEYALVLFQSLCCNITNTAAQWSLPILAGLLFNAFTFKLPIIPGLRSGPYNWNYINKRSENIWEKHLVESATCALNHLYNDAENHWTMCLSHWGTVGSRNLFNSSLLGTGFHLRSKVIRSTSRILPVFFFSNTSNGVRVIWFPYQQTFYGKQCRYPNKIWISIFLASWNR